jgi:quinoprotein glucose dehydrogenase
LLFEGHPAAQCIRCHRVGNQGGNAGPDLSKVAMRESRDHLLQSLVEPDAKIAPGFGAVTLVLDDGRVVTGIMKKEDETSLVLDLAVGGSVTIRKSEIDERTPARSSMPVATKALSRRELRDLVEYLSTLK